MNQGVKKEIKIYIFFISFFAYHVFLERKKRISLVKEWLLCCKYFYFLCAGWCSWKDTSTGVFDWNRQRGSTGSYMTGPSIDHTKGTVLYFFYRVWSNVTPKGRIPLATPNNVYYDKLL